MPNNVGVGVIYRQFGLASVRDCQNQVAVTKIPPSSIVNRVVSRYEIY